MKVIVSGASGLLGEDIVNVFEEKHEVIPLMGRKSIDITNTRLLVDFIEKEKPDLIIHSAGWRNVDDVEKNKDKAFLINTLGTKNMVLGAKKIGCPIVYISSDSVYNGEKGEPYNEFDFPCPVNTYGYSKLKAEEMVYTLYDKYFIVRVPLLFGAKGHKESNIIISTWEKIKNNEKVYAPTDQLCSPTYTKDIAEVLLEMVKTDFYGLYHLTNEGIASRYDLYKAFAEYKNLETSLVIPSKSDMKYARRPKDVTFKGLAFNNTFGIRLDKWQVALKRCIDNM
jgi:dTDP-4-dehydrorhamnose reductase